MTTLIFDTILSGHHIEYLHHLWIAVREHSGQNFVFAVPRTGWDKASSLYEWPSANNIKVRLLEDAEILQCDGKGLMQRCFNKSKVVSKLANEVDANHIILIVLASVIPFLPFMLNRRATVSGIIYKLYLRNNNISNFRKIVEGLRYLLMAKSRVIKEVFILNDPQSATQLNIKYKTSKFISLADPAPVVNIGALRDLREELNIHNQDEVFLHFGAMDVRKGTLDLLEALSLLPPDAIKSKVFIFAGKIMQDILQEFNQLKDKATNHGVKIVVFNDFVPFEFLNSLCHTCNCILIPYRLTDLSSGALGYSSLHAKPVIGPSGGLIGELIRDNNLGVTLAKITPEAIANAIMQFKAQPISSDYADKNSISNFTRSILSA